MIPGKQRTKLKRTSEKTPQKNMDKKLAVHLVHENVARQIYTKGVGRGNLSMLNRNPERARADLVIFLFLEI